MILAIPRYSLINIVLCCVVCSLGDQLSTNEYSLAQITRDDTIMLQGDARKLARIKRLGRNELLSIFISQE